MNKNKTNYILFSILLFLVMIIIFQTAHKEVLVRVKNNNVSSETINMNSALCSRICLENPVDIRQHLLEYYTTGNIHPFYEPYIESMGCYNLDKVEHKECCLSYKIRK